MGVPPMGCGPSSAAGSSLARRGPAAVSQRLPPSFTAGTGFRRLRPPATPRSAHSVRNGVIGTNPPR
jgi:hypothetical protein